MANSKVNLRLTPSFTGTIYEHIKKLIFDGKLKPGQRITVQEFATYFNVSITPVREAFQRLLAENFLSSNNANRNDLRVISLTSEELNQIYELYRALDIWGLKKNLARISDKHLSELSAIHESLRGYYEKRELKSYFRQNYEFHSAIWRICQNEFICQTLIAAQKKISIFITLFPDHFYSPAVLAESYADHCELMDALRQKDIGRLEIILNKHWREGFFPDVEASETGPS